MDDPGPAATAIIIKILLLFVLVLVNAFFAMSEIAIISLNDNKIQRMAEDGHKKAKQVVALTKNSSRFLSTIQIGVTLAGFLTSASAADSFSDPLVARLMETSVADVIPAGVIKGVCVVLITIITSYFSLVLGELAPKKIAMQKPEKISFTVVPVLLFVASVTKPFVKVLSLSTNGVVRLLGFDPNADEEQVTEEEIRMMVDVGEEKGVIENTQAEMIDNIFEFDDIDVGDIMTHRTDMVAFDADKPMQELVALAIEEGYSRIPVYEEDQDNIIGVVYVKDLLKYVGNKIPGSITIREIMRTTLYVPETKSCGDLFKVMTESHTQFAVVVDEYGGTAGIVTLEDIVESIVGNIQDEYDEEDEEVSKIDDKTFIIDGITDLDEVCEISGVDLPEGDYDTLGGFVISILGFLPEEGKETVAEYENLRFTVLNVEERRIGKVRLEILPEESGEETQLGEE